MRMNFNYIIILAIRDMVHDRMMSICHVMGMMAVLVPLLILFGLKTGYISGLTDRMLRAVEMRKLHALLLDRLPLSEIDRMKAGDSRIAFLVPGTREMAATLPLLKNPNTQAIAEHVTIGTTRPGDPVLPEAIRTTQLGLFEVVLSKPLADQLQATAGSRLTASVTRRDDHHGAFEHTEPQLTVTAVLDRDATPGASRLILTSMAFAEGVERYIDGSAREGIAPAQDDAPPFTFATVRIHAARLEDVPGLHADLARNPRMEIASQEGAVRSLLDLDRTLTRAYWVIAGVGSAGYVAALIATMFANVQRKRYALAVLGAIGIPGPTLILFPIAQALSLSLAASILSLLAYAVAAQILDRLFRSAGGAADVVSHLSALHAAVAVLVSCLAAILAAGLTSKAISSIDPSEVLHEH